MAVDRETPGRISRRIIVKSGAKLAYAAPGVAASMHLSQRGVLGVQNCECHNDALAFVFDADPPLDDQSNPSKFVPACCSCAHCAQLGAPNPSYDATNNICLSDGVATDRCYPLCTDVCEVVTP